MQAHSSHPCVPMTIHAQAVMGANRFDVINPATGLAFAQAPDGQVADLDAAVACARAAFPAWSSMPDAQRQKKINQLADVLESNMPELMQWLTQETGKPLKGLNSVGSGMEVGGAMAWTRATAALELPVEVVQDTPQSRIEVHRKPLGVVGSITPWNWPLMITIWHITAALRAGNTVVTKPSELTPLAVLRFVELANQVLPPGVLNSVSGANGAVLGAAMAQHPGIDKIIFTGSTGTGKRIMQAAAGNLKRLTLELGGNDAGIVLPDVNLKTVAAQLFAAAFHNNGQTCACLKRLYVHERIYEALGAELAQLAQRAVVGDGLLPHTELGPLQNKKQLLKVEELVTDARAHGARILAGGKRLPGEGYFYAPTIVADVKDGQRLVDEEQFGPVLPLISYSDVEDAVARANRSEQGLGGSVWSADVARATLLAQRLECGTAWINEHAAIQPNAPFGGVKQSGIGVEFGRQGLEEFTSIQTLKINKAH